MYYQLQEWLNHRAKTEAGKSILAFLVSYPQAQSSLQTPWPTSRRQREERGSSEAEKGDPQMGWGWRSVASRCLAVWGALVGPQRRTYDGAQGHPALPEQSRDHVGRDVAKSQAIREPVDSGGSLAMREERGLPVQIPRKLQLLVLPWNGDLRSSIKCLASQAGWESGVRFVLIQRNRYFSHN